MKVIMVAVSSINGKITRGEAQYIYEWTSIEDQKHFFDKIQSNNLLVYGRKTYESAKSRIKLSPERLRVVLTRTPEKYSADCILGQLEFSNESPSGLIRRLGNLGYENLLLLGGGEINTLFLKAKLVSEIYLTIEPKLFGQGKPLIEESDININLELISSTQLNKEGTLLLKYNVH